MSEEAFEYKDKIKGADIRTVLERIDDKLEKALPAEQTLTASGAITAGKKVVFLNHASTAIAATIATLVPHQGFLFIKAGLEPAAGQNHTVTVTTGTLDGTNKVATFADVNDALLIYVDAAGNGTILVNTGSVALS